MKIIEREPLSPYDAHEEKLKRQICRPDNPGDPYEATLREFLAVYTIIARRVSRQLFEEEIAVTGLPYDMRSKTDKIPDTLTAHLRLTREIRAQHRFLHDYLKKPMPTEDTGQDTVQAEKTPEASTSPAHNDREGRVHSDLSRPRPASQDQHPPQSAKTPTREDERTREPKPEPAQHRMKSPKPQKSPAKTDNKTPTAPAPVILLPEPATKNPKHPAPTTPEPLPLAAARNNPDQPTRKEFLRDAQPHTTNTEPP